MKTVVLFIIFAYGLLTCSEGAKILGIFPVAGKSLNILSNKLMVALANEGHNVTVISALKPKEKIQNGSIRHIHLIGFWEDYEELLQELDAYNIKEESDMLASKLYVDISIERWKKFFKLPEIKVLLKSNETFDAVITEDLWSDCFKVFSQIFNCPLIVFTSIGGNNPFSNAAIGNPLPPSYIPHFYFMGPNFNGMNFFQRLHNFLIFVADTLIKYYYVFPVYNDILQSGLENPPDIATFYNNISLVLLGSHSSMRQAGPLLPNVIEIGGFHIDPPKKLPKDLQDFLDGATHGAIYFSLGSHVYGKDMPAAMIEKFLKVFGKLKQKVLWKFEEDLPGKPDNVLIREWMPQTDILTHPNIKLFITHAGHGSFMEAVHQGVPCLMIPLFFDQFNNAYQAVQKGMALKISYRDEAESSITQAIVELLNNPDYRNNAKKMQSLFHDRPMKPLDTAIYWIEYVIRHKGADHLKIVALNMPWYQFYSVDVIVFLLGSIFVSLYFSYFVFRKFFCKRKHVQKQKIQ